MKITLSKQTPNRRGDIVALARLLGILEFHRQFHYPEDHNGQIILDLWVEHLEGIANHLLAANMGRVPEKSIFNLPFEEGYAKRTEEVK